MKLDPPIRTATSRDFYLAYLNSPDWRTQRNAALKRAGWKCERCPAKRDLEVHHKSYERLGREWPEDLEVLCRDCHRSHHLDEAEANPNAAIGVHLKLASQAITELGPFAAMADLSARTKELCAEHKVRYDAYQVDRALNLICGSRLNRPGSQPVKRPEPTNEEWGNEFTRDEAYELITRLFSDYKGDLIKRIPHAAQATPMQADRAKALQIIFAEIAASIERAEALEQSE